MSLLTKSVFESAVTLGDWFLGFKDYLEPARYSSIFQAMLTCFREKCCDEEVYTLFVDLIYDLFDILSQGQQKGHMKIKSTPGENAKRTESQRPFAIVYKESEDFFSFLLLLAKSLSDAVSEERLYEVVWRVGSLSEVEGQKPGQGFEEFRLRIMMKGFNLIERNGELRYDTLLLIFNFVSKHNLFFKLFPDILELETWLRNSGIGSPKKLRLFSIIFNQLKKKEPKWDTDLYFFLGKFVRELDSVQCSLLPDVESQYTDMVVEYLKLGVRLPGVLTYNEAMQSLTVQKLEHTEHGNLLRLVRIFHQGDLSSLLRLVADDSQIFEKYALSEVQCVEKMKLLEFATLASTIASPDEEHRAPDNHKVTLAKIGERLHISETEAESLVIKAIGQNIIDGRIDQMNSEVVIRSSLQRNLSIPVNEFLLQRFVRLSKNISCVLETIKKSQNLGEAQG